MTAKKSLGDNYDDITYNYTYENRISAYFIVISFSIKIYLI